MRIVWGIFGAIILVLAVLMWAPWLGDDDGRPAFQLVEDTGVTFHGNTTTPDGEVLCDGLGVDWVPFGRKVTDCSGAWLVTFWKGVYPLHEERPGWEKYDGQGFTLEHPTWMQETAAQSPYVGIGNLIVAWTANTSTYDAPNYSQDSWIAVSVSASGEIACTGMASSQSFSHEQLIGNVPFKVEVSNDAAMGNRYERTLYRTHHDGKCYDIVTTLHSASDWTDVDVAAIEESQDRARYDLMKAVESFHFE